MLKSKTGKSSTEFTALLYALLNFFDIDGAENFIATKWWESSELIRNIYSYIIVMNFEMCL